MKTVYIYWFEAKPKKIGEDGVCKTQGVIVLNEDFKKVESFVRGEQLSGDEEFQAIRSYDDLREELFAFLDEIQDVTIKMGSHDIEVKINGDCYSLQRVDPEIYKPGDYFNSFIQE